MSKTYWTTKWKRILTCRRIWPRRPAFQGWGQCCRRLARTCSTRTKRRWALGSPSHRRTWRRLGRQHAKVIFFIKIESFWKAQPLTQRSITVLLVYSLPGLDSVLSVHTNATLLLVWLNPIQLDWRPASRTVILSLMVSVLWLINSQLCLKGLVPTWTLFLDKAM